MTRRAEPAVAVARPTRMRLCVVVAAALALTACTASAPGEAFSRVTPSVGPAAPTPRADAERTSFVLQAVDDLQEPPGTWESARTDGERALLLSFTGAAPGRGDCESDYVGVAEVKPQRVVVRIDAVPDPATRPDQICPAIGYARTVRVELPEPLDGRVVVDARTGKPGPLLDGAALLVPSAIPDGYAFSSEFGSYGAGASWTFQYSAGDQRPVLTVTHAQDIGEPLEEGLTVLERTQVRGHEAVVLAQLATKPLRVSWRERGGVVSVQNNVTHGTGEDTLLLTKDELVAFARSLR
jgi:hypothetical protein